MVVCLVRWALVRALKTTFSAAECLVFRYSPNEHSQARCVSFPTPKPGVGFSDSAMLYKVICFASPSVFDAAPACWFRVGLEQRLARKRADAMMRPLGPLDFCRY